MRFDEDENLWLGDAVPGRHREVRHEDREVPGLEPAAASQRRSRADQPGQSGAPQGGRQGVAAGRRHLHHPAARREDAAQFEVFAPFEIPRPNVYDVIPDKENNGWYLPLGAEEVGRIDAKTGAITSVQDADAAGRGRGAA